MKISAWITASGGVSQKSQRPGWRFGVAAALTFIVTGWISFNAAAETTTPYPTTHTLNTQPSTTLIPPDCGSGPAHAGHAQAGSFTTGTPLDFFTNDGHYMARVHCMMDQTGQPDWPWIIGLVILTVTVVLGYLRIFVFWRRAYLDEAPEDRNRKLMQLAYIFLFCAVCGYGMSLVMFVWPVYRLLVVFLVALNIFTWMFASRLSGFKISLSANRLQRQLHEAELCKANEVNERLAGLTAQYRAVMSAIPDLFFVKSMRGEYVDCNEAFLNFFGFARVQIIGKMDLELFDRDFAKHVLACDERAKREGRIVIEEWVTGANGSRILLETVKSVAYDDQGKPQGLSCIGRDITERYERDEIVSRAKQAAEDASAAKSNFLANMSHEMRTPLNGVMGFAELLETADDASPEQRREWARTVRNSAGHLRTLIGDVLDLSKIESGQLEVEAVPFNPCQIIQDVVSAVRVSAIDKDLRLELEWTNFIPETLSGDPTRFKQVLYNLLSNAVKFTQEGGVRVLGSFVTDVDSGGESGTMILRVVDTGVGLSDSHLENIFQPFVQADSSVTRKFGGTGLGLSISRHLCRLMGGDLTVHSALGEGSTFIATFGTAILDGQKWTPAAQAESLINTFSDKPPSTEIPKVGRLLVADDGATNRHLIRLLLERAGHDVLEAENGQQAYDLVVQGEPFDLVLMDMQMPVLDGYEATRRLREAGHDLPVIAVTAHAMQGDRDRCTASGCSDYLAKPIERDLLLSTVQKWLADRPDRSVTRPATAQTTADTTASAVHDPAAGTARVDVDAHVADLSPLECELPVDDPDFAEIAQDFIVILESKLEAMRQAQAQADHEGLAQLAHWLKGSGGTAGYTPLSHVAKELERTPMDDASAEVTRLIGEIDTLRQRAELGLTVAKTATESTT